MYYVSGAIRVLQYQQLNQICLHNCGLQSMNLNAVPCQSRQEVDVDMYIWKKTKKTEFIKGFHTLYIWYLHLCDHMALTGAPFNLLDLGIVLLLQGLL